jgi:hypothetical protein
MRGANVALMLSLAFAACGPSGRSQSGDDTGNPPPDADMTPTGDGSTGEQVFVYAHSSSTLYKVDPDTLAVAMVGPFQWPAQVGSDQMTDLAINKDNVMVGISFGRVYRVDPTTAVTTLLSGTLAGDFNGLSFVPASMLGQTGDDVLVGTRNTDGVVFRIDPMTGAAQEVGNMGASYMSSGDLVAIAGFGTVQTTLGAPWDNLTKLAPSTFAGTAAPMPTGFGQIWGLAYWKGKVFGFTQAGQFITIDPTTGKGTLVQGNGPEWWGAAVTTLAPVIQ